jgi:hypothetical protein
VVTLTLTVPTPPPGGYDLWLPFPVERVQMNDAPLANWRVPPGTPDLEHRSAIWLPPSARTVQVYRKA